MDYEMAHTTVRISDSTHQALREMAKAEGRSMQDLLEEAVEAFRRKRFLEDVNAAYAALRGDAKAWAAVEDERREWDATILDGLAVQEARGKYTTAAKRPKARRRT